MKESNVTFDKGFWKSFGWFLAIAILICCLPWLFTRGIGFDFTQTGLIGDTIGGIMGPFVAIAAAGLTFIAFWQDENRKMGMEYQKSAFVYNN